MNLTPFAVLSLLVILVSLAVTGINDERKSNDR